jgi:hypothetical protein
MREEVRAEKLYFGKSGKRSKIRKKINSSQVLERK